MISQASRAYNFWIRRQNYNREGTIMDTKTYLIEAAHKVGIAEEAANLIAEHMAKEGYELVKGEKPAVEKGKLNVQPKA